MRYAAFRAAGLCTSTGVVDAGCRVAGADAIIALRCCTLSGRFEDFWERRAEAAVA